MKILAWYCVIINTVFNITFLFPNQNSDLPWYGYPIMLILGVIYTIFFLLVALNRNIPIALAYIARALNVFYGLTSLIVVIYFVINFDLIGIVLAVIYLPLLYFCEKTVRTILKLNSASPNKETLK